ncbi:hypothetical protein E4U22_002225 [Claviceps purpurea]|nr:hypothetical protein E4U12_006394 [Claviceps purpurea]KAG6126887.1 hypothetical protein E4U38_006636 [Claviceps purpurea]KAG6128437.1 hypothetical protein E4U28_008280 [Claviceps purpurea]KAG6155096.1 hypothetical protein E4U11_006155 [Claviceps purpurea]KAG6174391.1 hypothetical protein E4U27_006519 [Claviceps purpurea]
MATIYGDHLWRTRIVALTAPRIPYHNRLWGESGPRKPNISRSSKDSLVTQNQDGLKRRSLKFLSATNWTGIVRITVWKPRGNATRSPLIIGLDTVEGRSGIIYEAEAFETRSHDEALHLKL